MLCRWYCVQVVLCTYCTYGTDVHVVLCACRTCCVVYMRYYVYVHMVEEKALGVCRVWQPIRGAYKIRTKVEAKD